MGMIPAKPRDYSDGRTKQSFKDSTDVNKILKKAAITGSLSHLDQYGGQYGDFSDYDFFENQQKIAKGKEIFEALPAELRRDFEGNAANFFEFVNDPANIGKLDKLLPEVAKPGDYMPQVRGVASGQPEAPPVAASEPETAEVVAEPPVDGGNA